VGVGAIRNRTSKDLPHSGSQPNKVHLSICLLRQKPDFHREFPSSFPSWLAVYAPRSPFSRPSPIVVHRTLYPMASPFSSIPLLLSRLEIIIHFRIILLPALKAANRPFSTCGSTSLVVLKLGAKRVSPSCSLLHYIAGHENSILIRVNLRPFD
jgi:hypothetical protein